MNTIYLDYIHTCCFLFDSSHTTLSSQLSVLLFLFFFLLSFSPSHLLSAVGVHMGVGRHPVEHGQPTTLLQKTASSFLSLQLLIALYLGVRPSFSKLEYWRAWPCAGLVLWATASVRPWVSKGRNFAAFFPDFSLPLLQYCVSLVEKSVWPGCEHGHIILHTLAGCSSLCNSRPLHKEASLAKGESYIHLWI